MDIRNSLDGLKSLLGVSQPVQPASGARSNATAAPSGLGSDRATLSSAGSEVQLTAGDRWRAHGQGGRRCRRLWRPEPTTCLRQLSPPKWWMRCWLASKQLQDRVTPALDCVSAARQDERKAGDAGNRSAP